MDITEACGKIGRTTLRSVGFHPDTVSTSHLRGPNEEADSFVLYNSTQVTKKTPLGLGDYPASTTVENVNAEEGNLKETGRSQRRLCKA